MLVNLVTHICVIRPQRVNTAAVMLCRACMNEHVGAQIYDWGTDAIRHTRVYVTSTIGYTKSSIVQFDIKAVMLCTRWITWSMVGVVNFPGGIYPGNVNIYKNLYGKKYISCWYQCQHCVGWYSSNDAATIAYCMNFSVHKNEPSAGSGYWFEPYPWITRLECVGLGQKNH